MQKKKTFAFRSDLRPPLIICSVIGAVLLSILVAVTYTAQSMEQYRRYAIAAVAVYVVAVGVILGTQLRRYLKIRRANDAAEHMSSDLVDMFRYVVDIPYAVVTDKGIVKIVSTALQDILQIKNPICNIPLRNFCDVPISEIVAYAYNGGQVRDLTFTADGVPVDRTKPMEVELGGKKYDLRCYVLRSHGKDYYLVLFNDITELDRVRGVLHDTEPVVAYIVIDSLEELAQYIRVSYRTAVNEIELRLKAWAESFGGMLREYGKDRYLLVFEREALEDCVQKKFPILDTIRGIELGDNSFPVCIKKVNFCKIIQPVIAK